MATRTLTLFVVLILISSASARARRSARLRRRSRTGDSRESEEISDPFFEVYPRLTRKDDPSVCREELYGDEIKKVKEREEKENCAFLSDDVSICGMVWGKPHGDDKRKLTGYAALSCMGCPSGCRPCRRRQLVNGLVFQVLNQMFHKKEEIIESLDADDTEFARKVRFSPFYAFVATLRTAMDIFLYGEYSGRFSNGCVRNLEGYEIGVRAGLSNYTYNEDNVDSCPLCRDGDCQNALTPWMAWYIRKNKRCLSSA